MPKFLMKAQYTGDGLAGVMKDGGSLRKGIAEKLVQEVGGTLEGFWFAFGEYDAFIVVDVPDNKTAALLAMTVSATPTVSVSTVPLLTVEEVDAIAAAPHPSFQAPGT
jgi:uncharacterized protein with GYD domain